MSGFSGIIIYDKKLAGRLKDFTFPPDQNGFFWLRDEYSVDNFRVAHYSNDKFALLKGFQKRGDKIFGIDGVILDPFKDKEILAEHLTSGLQDTFPEKPDGSRLKNLRGVFSGIYGDLDQLTLFTDQTGSRQVFYYSGKQFSAFSSSLFLLRDILLFFGNSIALDRDAFYMMASFGFLLDDYTLVREIRKVTAGQMVCLKPTGATKEQYHNFYRTTLHTTISKELLLQLDQSFEHAIIEEYDLDVKYGFRHLSTLSGGLDSRMNVMFAYNAGFRDLSCLTFCEGYQDDEIIAREISSALKFTHYIILLNGGNYLFNPEQALFLNNCSVYYFGAANYVDMNRFIDYSRYGLLHNGDLAESSKGGYLSVPYHHDPCLDKRYAVSDTLFCRIEELFKSRIAPLYPNEEMFIQYNRGFNAIHNGSWMTLPLTESLYSFMDVNFADLAFSIDPKLRFNAFLTVEWLKTLHPEMSGYRWAKFGIRPTNSNQRILLRRGYNKILRTLGINKTISVTFDKWYNSNPDLRSFIKEQFENARCRNFLEKELLSDLERLFHEGTVNEKLLCISLLTSLDLLFVQ